MAKRDILEKVCSFDDVIDFDDVIGYQAIKQLKLQLGLPSPAHIIADCVQVYP